MGQDPAELLRSAPKATIGTNVPSRRRLSPVMRATEARWVAIGARYGPIILGIGGLVHGLTMVVIWSLGRAQDLLLPIPDAAVLLTVVVGLV